MSETTSRLFCGFRSLGYVCNSVPLVCRYVKRRRENLIVTSVGRSFHTYGGAKLALLSVSKIHHEDITALAGDRYLIYSATGNTIYAWRRGSELKHVYHGHQSPIRLLLPFGPSLISVDIESNVKIWGIVSEKCITEFDFPSDKFDITAIVHPPTYLDKILFGSRQGPLQLWNIQSGKKLYTFSGWKSAVLCLEASPSVLDAVAVGLESGEIIVLNIKYDETYVTFKQDWGPVLGLSFRSDRSDILVSSSSQGHIALWDLDNRRLACQMRNAHSDQVTGIVCLPQEPLMVTSSPDNSLKQWVFDMPDGGGRLLRLRQGHSLPPTKIRYYGSLGNNIISASEDSSMRVFSTVSDTFDRSFGVASYDRKVSKKFKVENDPLKMRPIVDFTCETSREEEWDNIGCVHRDTIAVTTWSFRQQKMGDLKLRHPRFKEDKAFVKSVATCVCLSVCGHFILIGYSSGHVDKYNIQSGLHRGQVLAHDGRSVRGIQSDGLNQVLVSGASDGVLKFWRFGTLTPCGSSLKLDCSLIRMELHRPSGLLAVALSDFSALLVDVVCRKVVRLFDGHSNAITDFCFSNDARWLLTASLDASLKVWDTPSGNLVDHIRFATAICSMSLSPSNDFLATAHCGDLGIYLWSNMSLYRHVSLTPLAQDFVPNIIQMPHVKYSQQDLLECQLEQMDLDENEASLTTAAWKKDQLHHEMVTLANLPPSKWQNLLNLDIIKARNKPKEAPVKPKNAPFFLPTVTGPDGLTRFDLCKKDEEETAVSSAASRPSDWLHSYTAFGTKLIQHDEELKEHSEALMNELKEKGPSAIDLELTSMGPEGGGSIQLMVQFLRLALLVLKSRRHFEAIQAYLALFLKLHGETILSSPELLDALSEVKAEHELCWPALKDQLNAAAALVGFSKSSLVA